MNAKIKRKFKMHGGHLHHQDHHNKSSSDKKLLIVFILNLAMSVVEFIGGFYTNSTAILSDALHDFGDAIALGASWFLERLSKRAGDKNFSFGYKRFSLLAALLNSLILMIGSVIILIEAFPRLFKPEDVHTTAMMGFAVFGLVINGVSVLILKSSKSLNEKVVTLHLLEDVMGWFAILLGSIVMYFYDFPVIDPLLSLLIALFILKNVYKNLKDILFIFLQGTPQNVDVESIKSKITSHPMIVNMYHVHVWSLDGHKNVLTAHIVVKNTTLLSELSILQKWVQSQISESGLWHSTIQYEIQN
jgi:cobalt-zinc-cadmium efflux system protein